MLARLLPKLAAVAAIAAAPAWATGSADPVSVWEADRTHVFDATEIDLDAFQWRARPVVVFANSPFDPAFAEQFEEFARSAADLAERDVVLVADTDPEARSPLRRQLRPRGFMMVLLGKDGEVALRKPFPWTVRELSRSIDKMPMRQREMRERR